jgi:hypothetical protein
LTKTGITDEGAIIIFKALEKNTVVSNLNIAKNYLTDNCLDAVVSLLKTNKNLKTIYFTNNQFTTGAKEKIKSYAKNNKIFI